MANHTVTVINSKGFHLRPASKLLQLVSEYGSASVTLYHPESGRSADCRNMMALMMMSSPQGTTFQLDITAENEAEIAEAISELFSSGFSEES